MILIYNLYVGLWHFYCFLLLRVINICRCCQRIRRSTIFHYICCHWHMTEYLLSNNFGFSFIVGRHEFHLINRIKDEMTKHRPVFFSHHLDRNIQLKHLHILLMFIILLKAMASKVAFLIFFREIFSAFELIFP